MPINNILQNATIVNESQITQLANVTSLNQLLININSIIYADILFFILMILFWIISFIAMEKVNKDALASFSYTGGIVSILSIFLMVMGLMSGNYAFIPAILTMIAVSLMWATKEK